MNQIIRNLLLLSLIFGLSACKGNQDTQSAANSDAVKAEKKDAASHKQDAEKKEKAAAEKKEPQAPALKTDFGVDAQKKVIKIGILNDESGPASVIGKPFGAGKAILAAQINAGKSGLLPEGWTVELVKRDHAYNPAKSQSAFDEIKNDVLFLGLSFGTPPTLPLKPFLKKNNIVAFPASLSSLMASDPLTPPAGPSYRVEAQRAMDWAVADAGKASKVKAAIIYQQDDYGKDGLEGWKMSAKKHGVKVVVERAIKPGQKSMVSEIKLLKKKKVTHIYLAVLPSATGPILGTAAKMKLKGVKWIGSTPAWLDAFFAHPKLPAPVFKDFYWANGMPYWGEKVSGMDSFLKAFEMYGKGARADFYLLMSYVQGLMSIEAAKRAIEAGDLTRAGYLKALKGLKKWSAGGLLQPLDMSATPYVVSTKTRILKPDFAKKSWTVAADYAHPSAAK